MTVEPKDIVNQKVDLLNLGSSHPLTQEQCYAIKDAIEGALGGSTLPLGGRIPLIRAEIEGLGKVVIKSYGRGGLLKHLNSRRYLRWGKVRSQKEFELLTKVALLGILAPKPIAFCYQGTLFYRAWLVMKEIEQQQSLAELSLVDEDKARELTSRLARQIGELIRHRIFHIDLHPGNVLVNQDDDLYLIDFDKAHFFKGPVSRLRDLYLRRWRRAVIKHQLPETLTEMMCLRLKSSGAEA